jgi:hypothetical protein
MRYCLINIISDLMKTVWTAVIFKVLSVINNSRRKRNWAYFLGLFPRGAHHHLQQERGSPLSHYSDMYSFKTKCEAGVSDGGRRAPVHMGARGREGRLSSSHGCQCRPCLGVRQGWPVWWGGCGVVSSQGRWKREWRDSKVRTVWGVWEPSGGVEEAG